MESKKSKYENLYDLCPLLFESNAGKNKHSCGFECGEGWYYPIRKLCIKFEILNRTY